MQVRRASERVNSRDVLHNSPLMSVYSVTANNEHVSHVTGS